MRNISFFLIVISSLYLFGCSKPKDIEFKRIAESKLIEAKEGKIDILMELELANPNAFGIELIDSDFEIYWGSDWIGKAKQKAPVSVPNGKTFFLPLVITIDANALKPKIENDFLKILTESKVKIPYRFKGECKIKKAGVKLPFPVDFTDEYEVKLEDIISGFKQN